MQTRKQKATAQLRTWLAEQFASEAAPFEPATEIANTTTRTGQAIRLELSTQCAAICSVEHISASTPFTACVAGPKAISDGHKITTTGAPEPSWPAPIMATPAFTSTGINLSPNSNNKRVSTDMAFLPNSLAVANFHLRNALGRKQPVLHFHE
jgi:hypothetical protein